MKSPKTLAILVLALTTIGGAVLGWQQYQELVELRAAAMNRDERADLQKRLWDLEKANKELQDQLAAARGGSPDDMFTTLDRPGGDTPRENRGDRGGRGRGGPPNPQQQFEALRKVLSKPEVQALINVQQKAAIETRYAALFKNLGLSPEQREKFESVVADFNATRMDVLSAAREQGIRNPDEIRKLMAGAESDYNNSLKAVLGDSGFAQYQTYEQTIAQRNLVNQLQGRLSNSDNPLTSAQAEQLVGILAANPAPPPTNPDGTPQTGRRGPPPGGGGGGGGPGFGGPGPGPGPGGDLGAIGAIVGGIGGDLLAGGGRGGGGGGGGGGTGGSATVTSAAINQSQGVLSQPQVAALQQIQQQQQTQQQLQQIVRDTLISTGPGNGPGGPNNPGGPPANPGNRKRPGGD